MVEFLGRDLPGEIDFGLIKARVRPYKRRILQCFKCLKIGHGIDFCRVTVPVCPKCSLNHEVRDCPGGILKCPNRDGTHIAGSEECSYVKKAKMIQDIQDDLWVPYDVAKTIYDDN